jgi:ADP-ribose pyrophosphatase YjhB (NUDIX family)
MTASIRTVAVAICRSGDRLLVERGHDPVNGLQFSRAIGGKVEFGELALAALRREWREEFGLELDNVTAVGVLQNIFMYEGRPGHEIVFAHVAQPVDAWVYALDQWESTDTDGRRHVATWMTPAQLRERPLLPAGLIELLPVDPPILEFGLREPTAEYVLRSEAYAVIFDEHGEVAVLEAPKGPVLPGGGQEHGEAAEQTAVRETLEACGLDIDLGPALGVVDELVFAAEDGTHDRKRCSFFVARFLNRVGPGEPDHPLTWMPARTAVRVLRDGSQRWAVAEAFRRAKSPRMGGPIPGHPLVAQFRATNGWPVLGPPGFLTIGTLALRIINM